MTSRGLQCEKNRHEEMIMENKRTGLKKNCRNSSDFAFFDVYMQESLFGI